MAPVKIGMASFAHMHAGSYASSLRSLPGAIIECIWDADEQRGKQMAEQFGSRYVADLDEFLASDISGVVICSENAGHRDLAVRAARAGRHILCEKPIATNVEDAREMIDAAAAAGVHLATAFPCRFSPAMWQLREGVRAGELGQILAIAGTNRGTMPGGWFIERDKSGGGAVIDHTVHVVDLMRWLTGAEVRQVYAEISNKMYGLDFDDCGVLTMEFDNGVFATLDTSWSRPKSYPTWGDVTMEVVGTQGTASLDMFNQKIIGYNDALMRATYHPWGSNVDTGLVSAFLEACRGNFPERLATGYDGLKALEVALAAYESARSGRTVALA